MRLAIGGVIAVLLLSGCGAGQADRQAAANRAVSPTGSASASPQPTLPGGVTRSPSPAAATGHADSGSDGGQPRGGDPAPDETATVTPVKVTLLRSGGFAGAHDELVVAKDGSWTYDSRQDGRKTGRLSSAQTSKLHRLANDPRLAEEARMRGDYREQCPDTFQYRLTAGEVTVYNSGCGEQPDRPVYESIVDLLADHTAF